MMAAARYFIYRGGGRDAVDENATHVTIDPSVTVIPARLFYEHQNIVELICHAGVERIEQYAFYECPRLKRLLIPGVEVVEFHAFYYCEAVTDIECPNLERIGSHAFRGCEFLSDINLPSAKVVVGDAFFGCEALTEAKFGKSLESFGRGAFCNCSSLERITIPLKNGLFAHDNIFRGCDNLVSVDLVEGAELDDTIDTLLLEEWRNDMNEKMDSITEVLPNADPGKVLDNVGEKVRVIREWITRVLRKIIDYKAQHRHFLNEIAPTLQLVLPTDIVTNNMIPFLELPEHTFEGEDYEEYNDNGDLDPFATLFDWEGFGEEEEEDDVEEEGEDNAEEGRKRRKIGNEI